MNSELDSRVRLFRCRLSDRPDQPGMLVDAYALITERYVVICDTMICPEDMEALLGEIRAELAGRQLLVINSHADWDHCWGNSYFKGQFAAPIIAHERCRMRLLAEEAQEKLRENRQQFPYFHSVALVPPTITFTKRLVIHGGDLTIELFPAPGHQPDHIAAWIPELRLLMAFDAAERPLLCLNTPETVQETRVTLQRLKAMQPRHVLCSHGQTTSPMIIEANIRYLDEIERRSRALLATRKPADEEIGTAALLLGYPLEEVLGDDRDAIDYDFYRQTHDNNIRHILRWLMQASG
ncbi:MAG: MBL fold metallo-hydrolase [Ktedonobacteraceae bacterium]|nr:MBL fold metallo-hydrolase [Ktedonobacteraceae bacterium]